MACPHDIVLDCGVVDVLKVVIMPTEIGSHSVLLQHWLQPVHQHLSGAMVANRPHWKSGEFYYY